MGSDPDPADSSDLDMMSSSNLLPAEARLLAGRETDAVEYALERRCRTKSADFFFFQVRFFLLLKERYCLVCFLCVLLYSL